MAAEDEFAAFCRIELPRLVGAIGLYCGDAHVAEEIAQEALARVWRKWRTVSAARAPGAYAQRTAINLANSYYRRKRAERRAAAMLTPPSVVVDADVGDRLVVRRALADLSQRQRAVLVLRYYLGYTVDETAAALGLAPGTVMSNSMRGLERMRRSLGSSVSVREVSRLA